MHMLHQKHKSVSNDFRKTACFQSLESNYYEQGALEDKTKCMHESNALNLSAYML